SFQLHVRFLSLFSQRLVIKRVSLLAPTVVWPQNADGKWRLPGLRKEELPPSQEDETPTASVAPTETQAPSQVISPSTTPAGGPAAARSMAPFYWSHSRRTRRLLLTSSFEPTEAIRSWQRPVAPKVWCRVDWKEASRPPERRPMQMRSPARARFFCVTDNCSN